MIVAVMDPAHPPGSIGSRMRVRDAEASRGVSPRQNVLGQVSGLCFIAKSVAPRAPAAPIAIAANLTYRDAEAIRPASMGAGHAGVSLETLHEAAFQGQGRTSGQVASRCHSFQYSGSAGSAVNRTVSSTTGKPMLVTSVWKKSAR